VFDFVFGTARFAGILMIPACPAEDDPFRPYKQTSYYAAANFAIRANASR
jgi:hypothetical protein